MMAKLTCCPHCGENLGLFSKETAKYDQYYKFDGSQDGYSEFHSIAIRATTPLYCVHCEKRVTTLEKLMEDQS